MNNFLPKKRWLLLLILLGILVFIIIFWGPFSIPLLGIMMIIAGYVLLKDVNTSYRIFGKIFLFTGISFIAVSVIVLSFLMPWGGVETQTTIGNLPNLTK